MNYATVDFYLNVYNGKMTDQEEIERQLTEASTIIDILTFQRIRHIGLEKCSQWERGVFAEVCCEIADFYKENSESLDTLLNKYSINGVTMEFGQQNGNIVILNGVTVPRLTYTKLSQTRFANLTLTYNRYF